MPLAVCSPDITQLLLAVESPIRELSSSYRSFANLSNFFSEVTLGFFSGYFSCSLFLSRA